MKINSIVSEYRRQDSKAEGVRHTLTLTSAPSHAERHTHC